MRKIYFFLMMLIGFSSMQLSAQDEANTLTVANGSTTNIYLPLYGYWADENQHNQIIYPESMLGDMVTGQISSMTFYLSSSPSWGNNVVVSLGITTSDHFTSASYDNATLTQVFSGTLNVSNSMLTFTFSTPYEYNGGNLLFDLVLTEDSYSSGTFYGISSTGGGIYQYSSYNPNVQNFIPKTTFTYTGGALCRTPYGITSNNITTTSATISWHGDENASSYNIQYMLSSETDWTNATTVTSSDTTVELTGLLASSSYKVRVQVECSDYTQTVWSAVHSFMTACDIIPFTDSWIEDFESTYQGSNVQRPLLCWAVPVQDPTTNGPFVYCGYGEACHSGVNSMEMKGFSGAMNIAVLPEFSADIHDLRLTFWATSTNPQYGTLEVGVMTDASDTSTFELVGVCSTPGSRGGSSAGNGNLMGPFDFDMVQATSGRIALRFTSNYSGSYGLSWNLDDFTVSLIPQCAEPGNLITGNVTSSSADISWNESPSNTYEVLYWTTDPTNPDIITNATLTDGVLTLTGLNPNTSYNWTVRTDCGDGTYANAFQTLSFTTPNVPVELPYEQDFETDPELITDFTIQGTGANQWVIGTASFKPIDASDSTEMGHSLYISNDNGVSNSYTITSTSYAYAILDVEFDDTPMEYHLSFDYKLQGEGTSYKYDYLSVYLMDGSATVPTNANPSGTALLYQSNFISDWTHKDYILENVANSAKKIVFYWKNDGSGGTNPPAAIDNISIQGFTCAQPAQLTMTDIASDNVTIDWTEVGNSTSWTISYGPAGYTVGNDDNEVTEVVSIHPYNIIGLTPATTYDIYVQSDCGSNWSGPLTITPGSFNMAATGSDTLTTCALLIYDDGGVDGDYSNSCNSTLVLYPEDPDSKLSLTGPANIENNWDHLYIYDGVGTEGTLIVDVTGESQTVNVLSISGPLTLHFTSDGTSVRSGFSLLAECVSCYPPTNLSASDVDLTNATISWSGIADEYSVYVILNDTAYYTTTDTFMTLTDLTPSSSYSVFVRSLCGTDSSTLSQPFNFSTSCGQIPITETDPWFENFESYGTSGGATTVGVCWATPETQQVDNGVSPFVYCGHSGSTYSGVSSLEMKGGPTMVVFPEFSNDINTLRISMWGNTTAYNASDAGNMALGYISDIYDPTTFVAIDTIPATAFNRTGTDAPHANFIGPYDFSGVTPQAGLRIALRLTDVATSATGSSTSWNLDDITISLIPDCPSPVKTSVTITDIDGHNATINFTDNDPTHDSWTIYYKIDSVADWSSMTTTTTSATLTNLDPETTYEVYVVTNCAGIPSEDATNHKNFTTTVACPAPTNVTVSDIGMTSATVSWVGTADSYTVVCGDFTSTETGNTATITGLTTATAYTVTITADCGIDGTSQPASTNFNTSICEVEDQCTYTFNLIDSYGDGWNNGTLAVKQNGITVANLSLTSGNSATETVNLCHGVSTELVWTAGNFAYEASFTLTDPDGALLYSSPSMDNYTTNYTFMPNCSGCAMPTGLTALADATSAVISWTGSADSYIVEYGEIGFTPGTGTTATVTSTTYNLTGLTSSTNYTVYVTSVCTDATSSPATVTFMTSCETIVNFPYTEGFENGLGCWISTPTVGSVDWTVNSTYNSSSSLPEGSSCVVAYSSSRGSETELASPIFDLTSLTNPYLSFYHIQTSWAGDQDELHIYYKDAISATPVLLMSFTDNISSWQMDSIALPNPSSQYQIIFKATLDYGHGVGLDMISVYDNDGSTPAVIEPTVTTDAVTNLTQTSATLNGAITNPGNQTITARGFEWKLTNGGTYNVVPATGTTMSYNLTNLTAETSYTYRAFATTANTTSYGAEITFTTLPEDVDPCNAPTGLTLSNVTTNSATATWTPGGSETAWNIQYKLQSASQWQEATVQTTSYDIEGLSAASTYEVRVKAICSADNQSDFVTTTFTTGVGIDNITLANSINLMPNPADNYIDLTINSNVEVKEAVVYNAFGQMIQTVELNDNYARIDLSDMAAGMYFVRVNGDNVSATKKFIKR